MSEDLDYTYYKKNVRPYIDRWVSQGGRNADMKYGVSNFMTGQGLVMLNALISTAREEGRREALDEVERMLVDEERLSFKDWYAKTKEYGGSREEWERLDSILNNENNLRASLREQIKALRKETE